MQATRLPRLHVITDTRGPVATDHGVRAVAQRDPAADGIGGPLVGAAGAAVRPRELLAAATMPRDPVSVVAAALAAGARLVQIRPEDHYTDRAAFDLAAAIAELCDAYGALCLVNDRVHIAQAVGADGVHLGAQDLPVDVARRILPAASIIGGTCRDPESARAARRAGATYLGVGPVWGTTTKTGLPQPIGLDGLAAVCEAVDLPVIAIGGITAERAVLCREAGAHGVAVVGAIASAPDPAQATLELLEAVGEGHSSRGSAAPRTDRGRALAAAVGESRPARRPVAPQADRDDVPPGAVGKSPGFEASADASPIRVDGARPGHGTRPLDGAHSDHDHLPLDGPRPDQGVPRPDGSPSGQSTRPPGGESSEQGAQPLPRSTVRGAGER